MPQNLEYAVLVWNPSLKKDIDMLENVQHRATRLVPGLKKESYKVRLKALKLTTLEIRRKRGDLIEFYKILNGLDSVEVCMEFYLFLQKSIFEILVKNDQFLNKSHLDKKILFTRNIS